MGFLTPDVPKPPPQANPAAAPLTAPVDDNRRGGIAAPAASLISTSVSGLKRRATTQRTSLIGGA